jgi:hypothetical protein
MHSCCLPTRSSSEPARLHHAARRRGSLAARGAGTAPSSTDRRLP